MCRPRSDTTAASDAAAALLLLTGSPPSSLDGTEGTPPLVTTEQPSQAKHNSAQTKNTRKATPKNKKPRSPRRRTSRTSQQPVKPELDYSGLTEDEVAEVNAHPALFRSKAIAVIHCRNQPDKYELAEYPCDKCFGKWECYVRRPEPVVESPSSSSSEPSTKKKGRCTRKTFAGTACASCKKGKCSFSGGRGGHNKRAHVEKTANPNLGVGHAHGPSGGRVTRNISATSSGLSSVNTLLSANTVDSATAVSAIVGTEPKPDTRSRSRRVTAAASRHSTATAAISGPNGHTHLRAPEPETATRYGGSERKVSYKRSRSYSFDDEDEDAYHGPDYPAAKRSHTAATTPTSPITAITHITTATRSDTEADVHPRRHMYAPAPPLGYAYHPHDSYPYARAHEHEQDAYQSPYHNPYDSPDYPEPQWLGRMAPAEGVEDDPVAYGDHGAYPYPAGTSMALLAPATSHCAHECAHCGSSW